MNTKTCIKCGETKSVERFVIRENLASGRSSYRTECKDCANEKAKLRKKLEVDNPRPTDPKYKCPICNSTESDLKTQGRWADRSIWCLDHDHEKLTFRGWICNNCNVAIGRLKDDVNIIKNALNYMKKKR